jgi:sporulation protein YqfC
VIFLWIKDFLAHTYCKGGFLMSKNIKNVFAKVLEVPKEVVIDLPLISMIGNEELSIENYKGVIEYSEEKIRINTAKGVIKIEGRSMLLKEITDDDIQILGSILKIEFIM